MSVQTETWKRTDVSDDDEELWLQEAAVQIAESGPAGVRFLISSISNASEWRLRAILLGLCAVKRPSAQLRKEICDIAFSFLHDRVPTIVAEAVDLLRHHNCIDAEPEVMKLLGHPSPYVVGSALRYLARHFPQMAIPLLKAALTSRQSIVRQNAVDELDELNCVQALPAIKRLLRDNNRNVREAAKTAVENLKSLAKPARQDSGKRRATMRTRV
jgi:hypothetical protein